MDEHVSTLDHIAVDLGEQALRPAEPPSADRRLSAGHQHVRQPERRPHGLKDRAGVKMHLVRALQRLHAVVAPADEIGGGGEPGEILGGQLVPRRVRQPIVGREPVASIVSRPRSQEIIHDTHASPPYKHRTQAFNVAGWRWAFRDRATISAGHVVRVAADPGKHHRG